MLEQLIHFWNRVQCRLLNSDLLAIFFRNFLRRATDNAHGRAVLNVDSFWPQHKRVGWSGTARLSNV